MSITPKGYASGTVDEVDAASRARKITIKGIDYRIGGSYGTGMNAGGASGANVIAGSFHWQSVDRLCLIRQINFSSVSYATPTAGALITKLFFVRFWPAADTGGAGSDMPYGGATQAQYFRKDSSYNHSLLFDFRVGNVTAATASQDAQALAVIVASQTGALTGQVFPSSSKLWEWNYNDTRHPLTFQAGEGFRVSITSPGGSVAVVGSVDWDELLAY